MMRSMVLSDLVVWCSAMKARASSGLGWRLVFMLGCFLDVEWGRRWVG